MTAREQWRFLGRETHWGHVFLVWRLVANPRGRRYVGTRYACWLGATDGTAATGGAEGVEVPPAKFEARKTAVTG